MPNMIQQHSSYRSSAGPASSSNPTPGGSNAGSLDRDQEERRMLPCRFFSNGYCHRGNRCRYYHPVAANMSTAYRVPPLPPSFGSGPTTISSGLPPRDRSTHKQHWGGGAQSRPIPQYLDPIETGRETSSRSPGRSNSLLHAVLEQTQSDLELDGVVSKSVNGLVTYEYDTPMSSESLSATTLFDHIDWEHFLAPGQAPPPIISVPEDAKAELHGGGNLILVDEPSDDSFVEAQEHGHVANQDMPPEGMELSLLDEDGFKKLSPKEELHMKVKEIAKTLIIEPQPAVRPLDSFFKQFSNMDMDLLPESMLIRTGPRPPPRETSATPPATSPSAQGLEMIEEKEEFDVPGNGSGDEKSLCEADETL